MNQLAGYDFIGDIHGHADELQQLLIKLGYTQEDGVFRHSERQVIFLGDFIDRGPKIREVLETVKPMVQAGHARTVMGNHEFNAIAFHTSFGDREEHSLRPRKTKNIRQHAATIQQLSDSQLADALDWFRTLPMWLEVLGPDSSPGRAVHACWDEPHMRFIEQSSGNRGAIRKEFMMEASFRQSALCQAVEVILKGKEIPLPEGYFYHDKDGHKRTAIRARWFEQPKPGTLYEEYVLQSDPITCPIEIDEKSSAEITPYASDAPPVFVGHYWLKAEKPTRLASNVACIDYSVAKGGFLCAYRWDAEQEISDEKFVWV
ncbi:MAG: metallophosphoesterase [bacterium]|nr:metallophosphoesterase [bacterium]